jgi:hypothetical protein
MVTSDSTSIFSYSGLHSAGMKVTFFALVLLATGCAAIKQPVDNPAPKAVPTPVATPTPTPTPVPTPTPTPLTAAQVFSNIAETWNFEGECSNLQPDGTRGPVVQAHAWIDVMPQSDGSTIFHYTKDQNCFYWLPDAPQAELYFAMAKDPTGAWYSTGGHIIAPLGFPWDTAIPKTPQDFIYSVDPADPGMPRPYLILADSGISVNTTFTDSGIPGTRWSTVMQTEPDGLHSIQHEGPCTFEDWTFAPGRGLIKVVAIDEGSCTGTVQNPVAVMTRTN